VITERLSLDLDQFDAGERLRDVRIIGSPIEAARQCFDLMRLDNRRRLGDGDANA